MKSYIARDSIVLAMEFTGDNRDAICKEMKWDPKQALLWKSEFGEVYFVMPSGIKVSTKDWVISRPNGGYERVTAENFDKWYQGI